MDMHQRIGEPALSLASGGHPRSKTAAAKSKAPCGVSGLLEERREAGLAPLFFLAPCQWRQTAGRREQAVRESVYGDRV